jgi:PAS domain S-box-containing protein
MKLLRIAPEAKIAAIYTIAGGLWILFFDKLAVWILADDFPAQVILETYKGWIYLAATALLLFSLIKNNKETPNDQTQNYSDIFETTEEGIFRSSPDGRFILVNPAMAKIYGYTSPQEMIESIHDIGTQIHLNPESRRKFVSLLTENGVVNQFEAQNIRKDKSIIWTSTNAREIKDKNGATRYFEGFIIDITKQKKTETALREAEFLYRTLIEQMPAAAYTDYPDNFANFFAGPQILSISGYSAEEWKSDPDLWMRIVHPDDKFKVQKENERTLKNGETFNVEYRIIAKNGQTVWIHDIASLVRDEETKSEYWQGLLIDITSRKTAEEFNKVSEARYHMLVEHASDGILISDARGKLIEANKQMCSMLGYEKDELLTKTLSDLISKEEAALRPLKLQELQSGRAFKIERTFIQKNGGYISVELNSKKLPDGNLINIVRDISTRRLLQETLARSEKRFRALLENSMDAIALYAVDGRIIYQSPASVNILGYDLEELIGNNAFEIIVDEDKSLVRKKVSSILDHPGKSFKVELRCRHKDGRIRWLDVIGTNLLNEPGIEAIVANYRDVTERKKAEEKLEHQLVELTILHSVALAETTSKSIDELIHSVTRIISDSIYPDNCGVLLLNEERDSLKPHPSYFGTSVENLTHSTPANQGICGMVVQTGKPVLVNDTSQSEIYLKSAEDILSELCAPIVVSSNIIGVLNIESRTRNAYTEADERLLVTIAGGLASAMERLMLFEHEQKLHERAEALREATASLTESLDIGTLYEKILSASAGLVAYRSASIELINGKYAEIVAQRGLPENFAYIGKSYELEPEKWDENIWKPVIISNVQNDRRFIKFPETQYIRGWMGIPLIAQERLIGFLNFDSDKVDYFTQEDAALLQTFANQAAVAVENSRHFEQESRRAKIIETIADIANETTASHDTGLMLDKVARRAMELLAANNVAIYLLQEDNETIKVTTSHGTYREELLSHTIKLREGITGNLIAEGKAEIVNVTSNDPRKIQVPGTPEDDGKHETMMSAPLMLRGQCIGSINVWRLVSQGIFSQMELNFLISIAHQTSIALEASHLLDEAIRNAQETSAIAEVGRNISSTLHLDMVLKRITYHAKNLLNAETSAIYLSQPEKNTLVAIAAVGLESEEVKNDPVIVGNGILGNIAKQGFGEIVNNTVNDPRMVLVKGTEARIFEHIMGVPIMSKEMLTGLLVVWRQGKELEYRESDLDFLTRLAQQAAIAIENARLFEAEQRRRKEADILREATIALTTTTAMEKLYEITFDSLERLVPHDRASIELTEGNSYEVVASRKYKNLLVGKKHIVDPDDWGGPEKLRQPIIIADVSMDNRFEKMEGEDPIKSRMGIPLITQDRLIGSINLDSQIPGHFTDEHIAIVQTLANQAATAIENVRLLESEKRRRKAAEILSQATGALTNALEINELLTTVLDWLNKIAPYDSASITLNKGAKLEIISSRGLPSTTDFSKVHFPINERWMEIANSRQPMSIHDAQKDPRFEKLEGTEYIRGWMGVPMFTQNSLIGFINLDSRTPGAFDNSEQAASVQIFANLAATAIDKTRLLENLQLSNQELYLAYDITLEGWGKALELRDKETQGHTQRVTDLTLKLARQIGISETELIHIRRGVLMHDIGKMGIPDNILHKEGPLTKSEMAEMRKHTQYAYDLIYPIVYLRPAIDIAFNHHEWWDGTGYPRQLKGEEIPLSARIFAIVDVWDALLSDRPYRKAWPRKKVTQYIKDLSGKQFDPNVVHEFFKMIDGEENPPKKNPAKRPNKKG